MKTTRLLTLFLASSMGLYADGNCTKIEGIKKGVISSGDGLLTLGGKLKEDYSFAKNPVFLNNDLPDSYSYARTIVELSGDYRWGAEKYGHDAMVAHSVLRHKGYWGDATSSVRTASSTIALNETSLGEHYHESTKPFAWFKELWFATSVDALCNVHNAGTHTIKAGYFPFMFGRGIALGDGYGTPKDFLGVYQRVNDYNAPGFLYAGSLYENKFGYDLYYAKFEDNSTSPRQVLSQSKAHRLDVTENKSWAGSGNDDELWGVQVWIKPTDGGMLGKAYVAPYIFLNSARDKKIEMVADSRSDLITIGCALEYECGGFECGGEVAFNRGKEHVYAVDRNKVTVARDATTGILKEYYSHILDASAGSVVPVVADLKTELQTDLHRRDASFDAEGITYYNASDRIREAYDNKYRGWMGVWDMAYTLKHPNIKFAISCGWVSGDANPNATEIDKEYAGFVGLNELYSGKRVKSVFMLDGRTLKRPLTFNEGTSKMQFAGEDGSFTDMRFLGYSASYHLDKFKNKSVMIQSNSMLFWKDHQPYKAINGLLSDTDLASRFMGTEVNIIASAEILKNLTVCATGALFIPGGYYSDISGTHIPTTQFNDLNVADSQQVDATTYRMGNDVAFFFRMGGEYKF